MSKVLEVIIPLALFAIFVLFLRFGTRSLNWWNQRKQYSKAEKLEGSDYPMLQDVKQLYRNSWRILFGHDKDISTELAGLKLEKEGKKFDPSMESTFWTDLTLKVDAKKKSSVLCNNKVRPFSLWWHLTPNWFNGNEESTNHERKDDEGHHDLAKQLLNDMATQETSTKAKGYTGFTKDAYTWKFCYNKNIGYHLAMRRKSIIEVNLKFLQVKEDLPSKHWTLCESYEDKVYGAGEAVLDDSDKDLKLWLNGDSGTYKPKLDHLLNVENFLQKYAKNGDLPFLSVKMTSAFVELNEDENSEENKKNLELLENYVEQFKEAGPRTDEDLEGFKKANDKLGNYLTSELASQ